MKRLVLLFLLVLLTACAEKAELRTHVSANDYIAPDYYLSTVNDPRQGQPAVTEYGIFVRTEQADVFRLLVNIGIQPEIYTARYRVLVADDRLYLLDGSSLLSFDLTAQNPEKTREMRSSFFPAWLAVEGLIALDSNYLYVYAQCEQREAQTVPLTFHLASRKTSGYFAVSLDGTEVLSVSFNDIPMQKRY